VLAAWQSDAPCIVQDCARELLCSAPVGGLLAADVDVAEPLDHATADPARDEHAAGEAMVRVQKLAILLVSNQHVAAWVHGVCVRHVGAI
jgi:hypothetical protein